MSARLSAWSGPPTMVAVGAPVADEAPDLLVRQRGLVRHVSGRRWCRHLHGLHQRCIEINKHGEVLGGYNYK
jgi:hypothetical protein